MKRVALSVVPALILLTAHALAGEPVTEQKPAANPAPKADVVTKKAAGQAKSEKTSPALDHLFDTGKLAPTDFGTRHPEVHFSAGAEFSVFSVRK